jgi:hypothetical protein
MPTPSARQREQAYDDWDTIVAARRFMDKWNAFRTNTEKNGHLPTLSR